VIYLFAQGFTVSADSVLKTAAGLFFASMVAGAIYVARKWPLIEEAFTKTFPASLTELSGKLDDMKDELKALDGKVDALGEQMVERRVRAESIADRVSKLEARVDGMIERRGTQVTS
jgi:hypothetical protein